MTNDTIGERIKALLKQRNMTQRELAEKAGCTEAAVSHYVKGDRIPRSRVMTQIAIALGTTTDYLTEGIPQSKEEDIGYAKKLIARNTAHMSNDEKLEIIKILMEGNDE